MSLTPNPSNDADPIDPLLEQFFKEGFSEQLGRAQRAVLTEAALGRSKPALNRSLSRRGQPLRWLIGVIAPLAAAATLAIGMKHMAMSEPPANIALPKVNPAVVPTVATANPGLRSGNSGSDVNFASYEKAVDDGIVFVDDNRTPIRRLRYQEVKQLSWLDPDGKSQLQVTVPQERVVFVEANKY